MEKKSGFSKLFSFFKQKEEIKEDILTNDNEISEDGKVIVVKGDDCDMVRADNFVDSSVMPEEYKVDDGELIGENNQLDSEEIDERGITVDEGDDMTPIIMDVEETETIDIPIIEEVKEVVEMPIVEEEEEII